MNDILQLINSLVRYNEQLPDMDNDIEEVVCLCGPLSRLPDGRPHGITELR
jgi:hypothetical protein